MKRLIAITTLLFLVILTGCASNAPLTEEQQAEKYGLTVEKFREEKNAAARMNMDFDEHMRTMANDESMMMDHEEMDMMEDENAMKMDHEDGMMMDDDSMENTMDEDNEMKMDM